MVRWMDGWSDIGQMNGWMDEWSDIGQMDGWVDGQILVR